MKIEEFGITFVGMEPSEALKKYCYEKFGKFEQYIGKVTSGEIILTDHTSNRGTINDFRLDINVVLPKSYIHVEEFGENMYEIIDKASDVFKLRLKRYFDKLNQWEGQEPWKIVQAREALDIVDADETQDDYSYSDYVPKIAVRKKIHDMRPMEEAEAIETMELMGFRQMLFKSKSTNKISMIYKREKGDYGLVEPEDEL